MKRKKHKRKFKNILYVLMIVLLLCMTLGYSFLDITSVVAGRIIVSKPIFNVYLENVQMLGASVEAVKAPIIENNTSISFDVKLNSLDDYYVFTVDVVNAGRIDVMLVDVVKGLDLTESQSSLYDFIIEYENKEQVLEKQVIKAKEIVRLKIRIEYKDGVVKEDLPETIETLSLGFSCNYVQNDGTGIPVLNNGVSKLIDIIINDKSYQAKENSTWDEWRYSAYNTFNTPHLIVQDLSSQDVPYENVVIENQSYIATECEVSGGWIFNEVLELPTESVVEYEKVVFKAPHRNNNKFFSIGASSAFVIYNKNNSGDPVLSEIEPAYQKNNGQWAENSNIINFGIYSQYFSKEFYLWFLDNAVPCIHVDEDYDERCDVCMSDFFDHIHNAYALILDNSSNSTDNPLPLIFVREAEKPIVGELYNSEQYGSLKINYVYDNIENISDNDLKKYPPWYEQRNIITSVYVEDVIIPKTTYAWFYDMTLCKSINIVNLYTYLVKDMSYLFYNCQSLSVLDWNAPTPDGIRIDNVVDLSYMFYNCNSLTTIDFSIFDNNKVENISYMFFNCNGLTEINLIEFIVTSLVYANSTFENCSKLVTIYANTMNFSDPINNAKNMFLGCTALVGNSNVAYNSAYVDGRFAKTESSSASPGYFKTESSCVTGDTLVTLSDGSKKRIDSIIYDDQLLVWDNFKGEFVTAPAAIIFNHGYANNTVIELKFSDNTTVKIINLHQFMDLSLNKYVSISASNVEQYLGHEFAKRDGETYKKVKLIEFNIREENINAYGIISAYHYNILVEDMFSTDFMEKDYNLFNYFEYGNDLIFDKEKMQEDIEKYGLYTYEDFSKYITYEQFVAFNIQYMKIAVGKGNYTYDQIIVLIKEYLK